MRTPLLLVCAAALLALATPLNAQAPASEPRIAIPPEALSDGPAADRAIAVLARTALAVAPTDDSKRALAATFRLQDLAGEPQAALSSLHAFHATDAPGATPRVRAYGVEFAIYEDARARAIRGERFENAYAAAFRQTLEPLDDRDAATVLGRLDATDVPGAEQALAQVRASLAGKPDAPPAEALALLRADYDVRAARAAATIARNLVAEEDARRWIVQRDIRIPTPDGATICALVVRARAAPPRAPAAFQFTIYADPDSVMREARRRGIWIRGGRRADPRQGLQRGRRTPLRTRWR